MLCNYNSENDAFALNDEQTQTGQESEKDVKKGQALSIEQEQIALQEIFDNETQHIPNQQIINTNKNQCIITNENSKSDTISHQIGDLNCSSADSKTGSELLVEIEKVKSTRRLIVVGSDISLFFESLIKETSVKAVLKLFDCPRKGVITFSCSARSNLILGVAQRNSLNVKLYASKSSSKKLMQNNFLFSACPSEIHSTESNPKSGNSFLSHEQGSFYETNFLHSSNHSSITRDNLEIQKSNDDVSQIQQKQNTLMEDGPDQGSLFSKQNEERVYEKILNLINEHEGRCLTIPEIIHSVASQPERESVPLIMHVAGKNIQVIETMIKFFSKSSSMKCQSELTKAQTNESCSFDYPADSEQLPKWKNKKQRRSNLTGSQLKKHVDRINSFPKKQHKIN